MKKHILSVSFSNYYLLQRIGRRLDRKPGEMEYQATIRVAHQSGKLVESWWDEGWSLYSGYDHELPNIQESIWLDNEHWTKLGFELLDSEDLLKHIDWFHEMVSLVQSGNCINRLKGDRKESVTDLLGLEMFKPLSRLRLVC